MMKMNFIANSDQKSNINIDLSKQTGEFSVKFTPGQSVYTIERNHIIKRIIEKVRAVIDIETNGNTSLSTVYILNDLKTYRENTIFANLNDIPVEDTTTRRATGRKLKNAEKKAMQENDSSLTSFLLLIGCCIDAANLALPSGVDNKTKEAD